ncbi:hypothetical protein CC1G_03120 [Coprinopsis cinerea okayama7|uniref:lytic cellulose monooxygenase (C4-dehydrogenating) n=1 Tax=Coprinopsis cinerea (strain Okayama-7 / 130 / ATCC MYA-4618 / FGSC 9003) TaxID=240176 RepID=A8PF06_COPC7|nr:hypothetical protein CC1G_03120 [Coprinopsis cinerea okayama7\|eukprot:XP_001840891.1 hypothetical protein CC1G_03120 [Coprinopsis cinerea okayama7\
MFVLQIGLANSKPCFELRTYVFSMMWGSLQELGEEVVSLTQHLEAFDALARDPPSRKRHRKDSSCQSNGTSEDVNATGNWSALAKDDTTHQSGQFTGGVDPHVMALLRVWLTFLSLSVASALAHYQFTALMVNGSSTGDWNHVRKTNQYTRVSTYGDPVKDVNSLDLRCNNTLVGLPSGTATIKAGDSLGFWSPTVVYHHGIYNLYMAKAPGNVSEWDGSGQVWFKVFEVPPIVIEGQPMKFPAQNTHGTEFIVPKSLPSGEYLVRIENVALHLATMEGPEFYVSCGQVKVTDGGDGTPGPLVAIPGVYSGEEPSFSVDVYSSNPKPFVMPGPPVWQG